MDVAHLCIVDGSGSIMQPVTILWRKLMILWLPLPLPEKANLHQYLVYLLCTILCPLFCLARGEYLFFITDKFLTTCEEITCGTGCYTTFHLSLSGLC